MSTQSRRINKTYWSSSVGSVSSSSEIFPYKALGSSLWTDRVWAELPRHSVYWLLLQEEHWVGGGCSSQPEDGESDLHVLTVRVGLSALWPSGHLIPSLVRVCGVLALCLIDTPDTTRHSPIINVLSAFCQPAPVQLRISSTGQMSVCLFVREMERGRRRRRSHSDKLVATL